MNGATILPFPELGGAAASRGSALGAPQGGAPSRPASAGPGFADAMDGALGSHGRTSRRDEPLERPRGPKLASLSTAPAKPKAATRPLLVARPVSDARGSKAAEPAAADSSRRDAPVATQPSDVARPETKDCAADTGGVAQLPATAGDDARTTAASVAGTADTGDTAEGSEKEPTALPQDAAGANVAASAIAAAPVGENVLGEAKANPAEDASSATDPMTPTKARHATRADEPTSEAPSARILRWMPATAHDAIPDEAEATGAESAEAGAEAEGEPVASAPAQPTHTARVRFEAAGNPTGASPQAVATAAAFTAPAEDQTAVATHTTPTQPSLGAVSHATAQQATRQTDVADVLTDAAVQAAAETAVSSVEQSDTDTAESDGRDSEQRQAQAAPARGGQLVAPASAGASDPVRFTVNVSAGTAAYSSAASPEAGVLPQIVQSIRMQALPGGASQVKVQLNPEHLGALNISLKVENGQVTATIHAEVAAVRGWIGSHESSLRQALSEQGLSLAKLIVEEDGEAPSGQTQEQDTPRRQTRRQSWKDETATFEVLV